MRWRRYFLSSVVGSAFLSGCTSNEPKLDFDVPKRPTATRGQEPDTPRKPVRPRTNFLDVIPEQPADAVSGQIAARIRATVNGVPIFEEEVKTSSQQIVAAIRTMPEPERTQKLREVEREILDAIIERELLIQDATSRLKKAGESIMRKLKDAAEKEFDRRVVQAMKTANNIKSDDQLKEVMRQQGLSLDMFRRQWTREFIANEYKRNVVMAKLDKLGHQDLQEYYDSHPEEFKLDDGVEWQDMYISSTNARFKSSDEARQLAEQIYARLKKGEDFLALANEFDDGIGKSQGGAGIGKKHGEIQPPDCEEALFEMKPGEVGLLEFGNGFHVFKLVKRDFAGTKPFDIEVQKEIRNKLRNSMFEREVKKLVADLRRKAIIEYSRTAQ